MNEGDVDLAVMQGLIVDWNTYDRFQGEVVARIGRYPGRIVFYFESGLQLAVGPAQRLELEEWPPSWAKKEVGDADA